MKKKKDYVNYEAILAEISTVQDQIHNINPATDEWLNLQRLLISLQAKKSEAEYKAWDIINQDLKVKS